VPSILPFRFLHTGDLHLDSPVVGLRGDATPEILALLRDATSRAWRNVVALAIAERVDFVVVAGDVFERSSPTLLGQTRFRDGLAQLAAHGIASYVVHGNHDPLDGVSWAPSLAFPPQTHRFGTAVGESAVATRDGAQLATIHGRSYPSAAVTDNFATGFRRGDEPFAIGLLHANVGDRPGHGNYAPCSLDDLRAAGIDYWALGHIHQPGIVTADGTLAVYCGNPQGRDPGEIGPRGAWLVSVDEAGRAHPEFRPCDVVRWATDDLAVDAIDTDEALLSAVRERLADATDAADGRSLLFRLRLTGRGPMHAALRRTGYLDDLRRLANEELAAVPPFSWLESLADATRPAIDVAARRAVPDFAGDFLRTVEAARRADRGTDPDEHEAWRATLESAVHPLFDEWARGRRILSDARPSEAELFGPILDEAEGIGIDLLLAAEES
jgi:DNA repair exonuclease SbcCD nuclease subunit